MDALGNTNKDDSSNFPAGSEHLHLSSSDTLQNEESLAQKLGRETQVLLGGALLGIAQTTGDRLSNQLPQTALETATFAGFSYAFVRLASSNTPARYFMPVLSAAMGYSFVGNMIKEFPQKSETISNALTQSWNPSVNIREQQQKVADTLGPFLFGTTLGLAAGLAAGKLAATQIYNKTLLENMKLNYGKNIDESVFRVASEPARNGLRQMGSSFAVAEDKLATAFHVVQDRPGETWTFINASERGSVKPIAGLPQRDIALMQTLDGSANFKALPLAKSMDHLPQDGVVVGALGKKIEVRPAYFQEGAGRSLNTYTADLGVAYGGGFHHSVKGGASWRGMSGGPAIAESGEVVGVLSSVNPLYNLFNAGTDSIPSPAVRNLMHMFERSKTPGAALTLPQAARHFRLSPEAIITQVEKGKMLGFVVPSSNPNTWEWRILR